MFTLIKTDEIHIKGRCSNPGDNLLTENAKRILRKLFGIEISLEITYNQYSKNIVNEINKSQIVFFSVPTYSNKSIEIYKKLVCEITRPIVPLSGSILLPPPPESRSFDNFATYNITDENKEIIRRVNAASKFIPCREFLTEHILRNNGFQNALYVGDLGMYEQGECLKKMEKKSDIQKILFTIGHYGQYKKQIIPILAYLRDKFPNARIIYSTHQKNPSPIIRKIANKYKLEIVDTSYDEAKMNFYKECDLHIGYRLHGHIKCLSCGIPSILIAEDSRSSGFKLTLGNIGIFLAYGRKRNIWNILKLSKFKNVKPTQHLITEIDEFLEFNLKTNFSSYKIIPDIFHLGYNNLISYLTQTVPPLLSNQ